MRRTFCKKEKDAIKRLVKKMDLELYRIRFCIGNCEAGDVTAVCDFLLEMWNKIVHNRRGFFFTFFLGLVRELVIEVKGENCVPYLQLLCFAEKKEDADRKGNKILSVSFVDKGNEDGASFTADRSRGDSFGKCGKCA